jgi:hypothetical protein
VAHHVIPSRGLAYQLALAPSFLWHALSVALKVTCQVGRHTLCLSSTSLSSQNDHLFQSMLDQSWTQYLSLEVGRVCQIRVPGPDIRGRLVWLRSVVLACGRALGRVRLDVFSHGYRPQTSGVLVRCEMWVT